MPIEKTIKKVLKDEQKRREKKPDFLQKQGLFLKMRQNGLLKPESYGIAPLDTIGKRKYQSLFKK